MTVPLKRLIACIQRTGFWRKLIGAMIVQPKPLNMGLMQHPMSPMSWYWGSQLTMCWSPVSWRRSVATSSFTSRFRWLSITPLGRPVEPEVYWRKARVSVSMAGRFQS